MLTRLLLRTFALASKFLLTIVLARTLGFASVATYGLVVAVSVIASKALGLGFSSEINRQLSRADSHVAIRAAKKLCRAYGVGYLVAGVCAVIGWRCGWMASAKELPPATILVIWLVIAAEHCAFELNSYVFSLHRDELGSLMLFVRNGAWPLIAIAGLLTSATTNIEHVFLLWMTANLVVIGWGWRVLIRSDGAMTRSPHDGPHYLGAKEIWKSGFPFYAATLLMSIMQYAERLVAAPLVRDSVLGQYVFSWSVANSVQTVAYAVVVVTAAPRLAQAALADRGRFGDQLYRSLAQAAGVTICMAIAIAGMHDAIFGLAHHQADSAGLATLGILLASFTLRSLSDVLWAAAIALRAGWLVCGGIFILCTASPLLSYRLISTFGESGAALAHLCLSFAMTAWLAVIVMYRKSDSQWLMSKGKHPDVA